MEMKVKPKKTVLIAMDESIQSIVAAYLLKKQGLNCIAISFVFSPEDGEESLLPIVIKDIKKIKAITKKIEIAHYAIDAKDAFKDSVIDNLVSAKIAGHSFSPAQAITKIIFDQLIGKMEALNADFVSSGHFARVIFNQAKHSYALGVANDLEFDESRSLALLTDKHLEKMILPLSDIKYSGALKIAEMLALDTECLIQKKRDRFKLIHNETFLKLVEKTTALSLREKGEVRIYDEDGSLCEHDGVHKFHIGQNQLEIKSDTLIDKKLEVISIVPNRQSVYLAYPTDLKFSHCQLFRVHYSEGLNTSLPLKVYFHLPNHNDDVQEKVKGKLYLKTGMQALLILEKEQEGLLPTGEFLVFYDKRNEGGRVIGYGEVKLAGFLFDGRLRNLPLTKQESEAAPANKLAPIDINLKF